jgi:hypothetical protein
MRKVQNRKAIFTTVTFVVNAIKTISRQHQNLTGFSVENALNVCMNPVTRTSCILIHVEGMRRGKIARKRDRNSAEAYTAVSLFRDCNHICLVSSSLDFIFFLAAEGLFK